MDNKLKDYTEGKTHYTPIMNIIMNNRSRDWYAELGQYIIDTLDIETIPELSFFSNKLKEKKSIISKVKDFINSDNRTYTSIAISFLTSALNENSLEKMFGKPLLHDEFGEGFEGEYDDETDEFEEPEVKESYASYFVNVSGTNFHIGYDHRGTGIEIEVPNKFEYGIISDSYSEDCFENLEKLVNLYKEKVNN